MSRKKYFQILFLTIYFVSITFLVFDRLYYPTSLLVGLLFLLTNLPPALIFIIKKNEKELRLELKSREADLSLSRQRWDSLLNMLPQMVFEYQSDHQAKIIFINEFGLKLFGYKDFSEMGQKSIFDLFDPAEKERVLAERRRVLHHKTTSINEYIGIHKNGKRFPVALYSAPVYDVNGRLCGVRGVLIDLSEINQFRETIEELKNLDKIKDDFLNIAAHELKTPLSTILMTAEILKIQSKQKGCQEAEEQIDMIFEEASRLKRVVEQILTVTRFENGKNKVKKENFDLFQAIRDYQKNLESLAVSKKTKISFSIPDEKAIVKAEKEKLLEVLYNFVDNALKYGKTDKGFLVLGKIKNKEVIIEVKDFGPGIPKEDMKNMFLKFSQLENPLQRRQEGIGLGLYISRLIIESSGGKIGIDSFPGKGSTFYFSLPLVSVKI